MCKERGAAFQREVSERGFQGKGADPVESVDEGTFIGEKDQFYLSLL